MSGLTQLVGSDSPYITAAAIPVAIALFHTTFNIINTSNRFIYSLIEFSYRLTEPVLRKIRMVWMTAVCRWEHCQKVGLCFEKNYVSSENYYLIQFFA